MSDQKKDSYDVLREIVNLIQTLPEDEQLQTMRWACEKLNINIPGITQEIKPDILNNITQNASTQHTTSRDIKTFIDGKKPSSDNHFAAAVAYYYQFEASEKKDTISMNDLIEATRLVGRTRIKRPDQTLVNATKAGYLDNISRGAYRLNSVGENLVAMVLPNTESTATTSKKRKKIVRNTKKKK
ncbi:hypothetical protein KKH39_01600 [Patescibacteria group bacterium]|nr:hypothetical protein [Patescibacteria group bacterium]